MVISCRGISFAVISFRGDFFRGGRSPQQGLENIGQAILLDRVPGGGMPGNVPGDSLHPRVVHQEQGLRGNRGRVAIAGGSSRVREVKERE